MYLRALSPTSYVNAAKSIYPHRLYRCHHRVQIEIRVDSLHDVAGYFEEVASVFQGEQAFAENFAVRLSRFH